ncbi:Rz-like spanin [Pseudomonas phage PhiPA3]|uniref:Virion structural protein n=1 Tax=Pseudomonas phage PhiPA3 TaxID=998086 RepID=F8SK33_BPPA3|nr:Rz-like spanin [Pseudomonas phage PhiPA3]AEH03583.1 virion structural protein [Pseudomonas phage PhiPA3]
MFQLLKSSPLRWVLVGLVIAVVGGLVFFYNEYTDAVRTNGELVQQNDKLERIIERNNQSAAITDQIVSDTLKQTVDAQKQQEQSRIEVIDEYINLSHQTAIKWPTAPKGPPVVEIGNESVSGHATKPSSNDVSGDSRALYVLVTRMREQYCKAGGEATYCNTQSTTH